MYTRIFIYIYVYIYIHVILYTYNIYIFFVDVGIGMLRGSTNHRQSWMVWNVLVMFLQRQSSGWPALEHDDITAWPWWKSGSAILVHHCPCQEPHFFFTHCISLSILLLRGHERAPKRTTWLWSQELQRSSHVGRAAWQQCPNLSNTHLDAVAQVYLENPALCGLSLFCGKNWEYSKCGFHRFSMVFLKSVQWLSLSNSARNFPFIICSQIKTIRYHQFPSLFP